jgi:hypothetical protein
VGVLGNLSIRRKLIAIIMMTTCIAILLACVCFVVYEVRAFRKTTERDLSTIAQLISETSAPGPHV